MNYNEQVKSIKTLLKSMGDDEKSIEQLLVMIILDPKFDRAAICQAEKEFKNEALKEILKTKG